MTKKHKLLVIDDSKETVAGLNSFLSQKYDVLTAYNGLDGLKAFETNEAGIDLVITDLVLSRARRGGTQAALTEGPLAQWMQAGVDLVQVQDTAPSSSAPEDSHTE